MSIYPAVPCITLPCSIIKEFSGPVTRHHKSVIPEFRRDLSFDFTSLYYIYCIVIFTPHRQSPVVVES